MPDAPGHHPGPVAATLPPDIREAIVAHARAEYPNEACGIIVGDRAAAAGGRALRFVPMRNAAASPLRYRIDDEQLLRLTIETDDADEAFWAIVHSHVRSAGRAVPDRHRPGDHLSRPPVRARLPQRRRGGCRDRRAERPGVADPRR